MTIMAASNKESQEIAFSGSLNINFDLLYPSLKFERWAGWCFFILFITYLFIYVLHVYYSYYLDLFNKQVLAEKIKKSHK